MLITLYQQWRSKALGEPWFNSNLGALNSLDRPPRAKTGRPKCWERRWCLGRV